jgi:hypothetical protein
LKSSNFIGYTNLLYGFSGFIVSALVGYLTQYTTIVPFLVFMFTAGIGFNVFILSWEPNLHYATLVLILVIALFAIFESICIQISSKFEARM